MLLFTSQDGGEARAGEAGCARRHSFVLGGSSRWSKSSWRRDAHRPTSPQTHSHYLWDSHGGQSLWEINCIPLKTFNGNPFSDKQFHFIPDKGRPQYVHTMPSEVSSVQFQDPSRDLTEFPLSTSFTRGEEIYLNLSTIFAVKFSSTPCWWKNLNSKHCSLINDR